MYQLQLLQREMPSLEAQLAPPVKFNLVLCLGASNRLPTGRVWGIPQGSDMGGDAEVNAALQALQS